MKITKPLAALSLTALLGLTACGGSEQAAPEAPKVDAADSSSSATATESAEPKADEPERSPRGNLIKVIGQGAGTGNPDNPDEQWASFVVNAIDVDPVCTGQYAAEYPNENGHFVVLDVSIETFPELAESDWPTFDLNPYNMKVVAPNGTTSNAELNSMATYNCFDDAELLPSGGLGPAEKATGKIVLDSEVPAGTLVITQGGPIGWEYEFGAKPAV